MLPDEMEAEKNRKLLLAQADEIEIYRRNIKDLQAQLNVAHASIAVYNTEWSDMSNKLDSANQHNTTLAQSLANAYADISRLTEQECFCGLADEPVLAGRD